MRINRRTLLISLAAPVATPFLTKLAAQSAASGNDTVLIQNATILTITNGTVKGSILLQGGKIAALGEKVLAPAGAKVIDGAGKFVMPGIIDCHSHIMA